MATNNSINLPEGSAGQVVINTGTGFTNTTATYPSTTTINQILYSSSANVVSGLATSAAAVLTTVTSVPTWAAQLSLTLGGTNASLTASNGGIFYSTSTAGAILAGTATAGLALLSGASTTPSWSTAPPITKVIIQTFTVSGTYTPTTGMKFCKVELVGGGGGSGGVDASLANSGSTPGGASGGYSVNLFTAATVGASQTVTIGAGGNAGAAGNNNGTAGSATTFGALLSGSGGNLSAGTAGNAAPFVVFGSAGAVGSIYGQATRAAPTPSAIWFGPSTYAATGLGGSNIFGAGGAGTVVGTGVSTVGAAAVGFGGGGGGAAFCNEATDRAGAAGNAGLMIITEYVSV